MKRVFILELIIFGVNLVNLVQGEDLGLQTLAIVNDEKVFINNTYQECNWNKGCSYYNFSCRLIDYMNGTRKEFFRTVEEAQKAVEDGKAWGVLHFNKNFSDALLLRLSLGEYLDNETKEMSKIGVWLNNLSQTHGSNYLREVIKNVLKDEFRACENHIVLGSPYLFHEPMYSKSQNLAIVNNEQIYVNQTYQLCPWEKICIFRSLSCRFLDDLQNTSKLYYPNLKEALNTLKSGKVWGVIYINENFTDAFVAKIALGQDSDEETVDQSRIKVWLNAPGTQASYTRSAYLQKTFTNASKELYKDCSRSEANLEVPFRIEDIMSI